jgi:hypothetical protein
VIDNFGKSLFDVRGVDFGIAGFQCSRFQNLLSWLPTGRSALLEYNSSGWLNVNWEEHASQM